MLDDQAREMLSLLLYDSLHCRRSFVADQTRRHSDSTAIRELTHRLSEANSGTGCWQAGWRVTGKGPERIEVGNYGIRWFALPRQIRAGADMDLGATVHVRVSKEQRELFPGFYMTFGNADDDPTQPLVRFYWNISVRGAAPLMSELTRLFNEAEIPFRFKMLNVPSMYGRTDSAVLYVPRAHYRVAHILVSRIRDRLRNYLLPQVSALVKRIAPGVGLAEDPGPGKSFGRVVTGILAEALAERARAGTATGRMRSVLTALRARGVDPKRPYLMSGSIDDYQVLDA